MRALKVVISAIAVGAVLLCATAQAAPRISNKVIYYQVHGDTPPAMLAYMLRNGPHGANGRALGTTGATLTQSMHLQPIGAGCRIRDYRLTVAMTQRLPKLAPGVKLNRPVWATWNGLAAYVRVHENRHRSIFTACAKRIEQRIRALGTRLSCSVARARVRAIFAEENRKCDRIHAAFDRRETARVAHLPFIRQATGIRAADRRTTVQRQTTRRTKSVAAPAPRDLR